MKQKKTAFRPDTHGYAFINSWQFDDSERQQMNEVLSSSSGSVFDSMPQSLSGILNSAMSRTVSQWIESAMPDNYGLCGGMAFSSLDFFKQGKPLPTNARMSEHPTRATPAGAKLREYLWKRQLESFSINLPGLLSWMLMLHGPIPGGGAGWLRDRSREEWEELKRHIDGDTPWPLALIGSSTNPFDNHQVLAYGYEDPGDGTGVIYLYDMNCPDREHTTRLDFRGEALEAKESCPGHNRGPLRGFFCETYRPDEPPTITES
jgi:hypothetical protein